MKEKPTLAAVFGHFSNYAEMTEWQDLEPFMNPAGMFGSVHAVAIGDDRPYPSYDHGTLHLHRIRPLIRNSRFRRVNDFLVLIMGTVYLWRLVRRFNVDLIAHIDSTPVKYGVPAVIVGQLTGAPSLITLHSDYGRVMPTLPFLLRIIGGVLWPYVFRRCTRVRSVSRPIAEFALEHDVPAEKIDIIPNKENLALFRERKDAVALENTAEELGVQHHIHNAFVFLSVGRLIALKNLHRCLEAFAITHQKIPDLTYLIVGAGPLLDDLSDLASRLSIADRVHFLGHFPHRRLAQIYHLSDAFLFPTLWEGHPRVVLEAMAARLPIICSNYGAITDLVGPEDSIQVDPTDVKKIAEAMRKLAADKDLRTALSEHPTFDPEDYSLEAIGRREAAAYADMLAHSTNNK